MFELIIIYCVGTTSVYQAGVHLSMGTRCWQHRTTKSSWRLWINHNKLDVVLYTCLPCT